MFLRAATPCIAMAMVFTVMPSTEGASGIFREGSPTLASFSLAGSTDTAGDDDPHAPLRFHSAGAWHSLHIVGTEVESIKEGLRGIEARFGASSAKVWLTNQILVGVSSAEAPELLERMTGAKSVAVSAFSARVYVASFATPEEALSGANALIGQPGILYAHPDFLLPIEFRETSPKDEPLFPEQWHLANTGQSGGAPGADNGAAAAWIHSVGDPSTVVAILDGGFEQGHPDLRDAWYVNPREVAGNRRDDDDNGLIDDVNGWNFATNGNNLIYGFAPSHGTAVAGVVGARANGLGVTGVCPRCTILPIVIDSQASSAAAAFHYAKQAGASVATNSWGYAIGTPAMDVVVEAIADAARDSRGGKGMTIIFATNNAHVNICRGPEPDISSLDTVLAISSTDHRDVRVPEGGYGPCLDLVSPSSGVSLDASIATVDRQADKGYNAGNNAADFPSPDFTKSFYGTSAAAPQVAGVFALLYSLRPSLTRSEALDVVTSTAAKVDQANAGYDPVTGHSLEYGFGRIDGAQAIERAARLSP